MRVPPLLLLVFTLACGSPGETRRCFPSGDATGAPQSISDAVALFNVLPHPTNAACFVESLDRPIGLTATSSTFSAQPAEGSRSPRIFLFSGPLVISVVPSGAGAHLIEFSELIAKNRSVKAELELPVLDTLPPEAPFVGFEAPGGTTTCAFCHAAEAPQYAEGTAIAFASEAFRPEPT